MIEDLKKNRKMGASTPSKVESVNHSQGVIE
jgi:hypothetical protein